MLIEKYSVVDVELFIAFNCVYKNNSVVSKTIYRNTDIYLCLYVNLMDSLNNIVNVIFTI